jgi:predicted GNAT family acetyltransferase
MAYVALETAIAEEQKIVPECPFVKKYLQRHPEYEWLVVTLAEGD